MGRETWKPVPSAPGWFASSLGRVQMPERKQDMPRGGYRTIEVSPTRGHLEEATGRYRVSANGRTRRVAQMVCEAFHGARPSPTHECMHIDENSKNDVPSNLCWGTKSENQKAPKLAARRSLLLKQKHPLRKLDDAQVEAVRQLRGIKDSRFAAAEFGISRGYVYQIWRGCRG